MPVHRDMSGAQIHVIHAFEYASATERINDTSLTSSDVGKVAWQTDSNTFWVLLDATPTWTEFQGFSGNPSDLNPEGATDQQGIVWSVAQSKWVPKDILATFQGNP